MTAIRGDMTTLTAAQAAVVYEDGQQPVGIGAQGRDGDGNSYVMARLVEDVTLGQLVSEKRVPIQVKSATSYNASLAGRLKLTINVAANTVLAGENEIDIFIDTTHADIAQRLYRVSQSGEIRNDTGAAADVDVPMSLRLFASADDVLGIPQFPLNYKQATANKILLYRGRCNSGVVSNLSGALNNGESYDILGVAQRAITASASAPRCAWLATGGVFHVDTNATSGSSGEVLLAGITAGDKGAVRIQTSAIDPRFPVGILLQKVGAAGLVLARLSIATAL